MASATEDDAPDVLFSYLTLHSLFPRVLLQISPASHLILAWHFFHCIYSYTLAVVSCRHDTFHINIAFQPLQAWIALGRFVILVFSRFADTQSRPHGQRLASRLRAFQDLPKLDTHIPPFKLPTQALPTPDESLSSSRVSIEDDAFVTCASRTSEDGERPVPTVEHSAPRVFPTRTSRSQRRRGAYILGPPRPMTALDGGTES
jgi:hypothetical protein